jgi:hypothetical protein
VRRQELLRQFADHVYGRFPEASTCLSYRVTKELASTLGGRARLREVEITVHQADDSLIIPLLIYLPIGANKPVPVMLAMNFFGNHAVIDDPNISLPTAWLPNSDTYGITNNVADSTSRGARAHRWDIPQILSRGYAFVTLYRGDLDPDRPGHWEDGVHPLYYRPGQRQPDSTEWGAIGAWAWGYSRAVDYLLQDPAFDASRIVAMGHSRLGKAVLWAGANDERIALVVSNNSGCGGAALSRREYGETVSIINTSFPHWFSDRFTTYNDRVDELPVDQHELIALIAPRPVYIASAVEDRWADPRGEFLAALHAGQVYRLYGLDGLGQDSFPVVDAPIIGGHIGYHLRSGGHDVTPYDWKQFLDFADLRLGAKKQK